MKHLKTIKDKLKETLLLNGILTSRGEGFIDALKWVLGEDEK